MVISPVKFAGIKDFIVPIDNNKQGQTKSNKIYSLTPDAVEASKKASPCGVRGYKIKLPDDSFAYIHPRAPGTDHRIGAHKLAKLLQFDISPKVKALEIPNELNRKKAQSTDPYGSIVDWVEGPTFSKFKQMPGIGFKYKYDVSNLIELYFFHLLSQDADCHQLNIIVQIPQAQTGTVKLFSIDNEMAASTPEDLLSRLDKYPAGLRTAIQGKPIPDEIQEKLQHFLRNKETGTKKLRNYFPEESVENTYKIAQFLLEQKTVPTQQKVIDYFNTLCTERKKVSIFKQSQRILENLFKPQVKQASTEAADKPPSSQLDSFTSASMSSTASI